VKPIRVLIADDSSLARGLLLAFLEGEPDITVVGEARNGREAVEMAQALKPDLVTMDLEMPQMDGLAAIEEIMCSKAVPILVVSGVADAQKAYEAVRRGALEVVSKPDYTPEQAADFVAKVRLLAGVSVITRMRSRTAMPLPHPIAATPPTVAAPAPWATLKPLPAFAHPLMPPASQPPADPAPDRYVRVFAIASSTGGPQALAQILPALPAGFPAPVLIAQHIAEGFAAGMADWLGTLCALPVRLASEGELVQPATIYIAPSEKHLAVSAGRRLTLLERRSGDIYRPSCDALLDSVAEVWGRQAIGIILTGMGSDGAKGMARIRGKGGLTLAQDEKTSVIYGMNRVAVDSGAVERVLPVEAIAGEMRRLVGVA